MFYPIYAVYACFIINLVTQTSYLTSYLTLMTTTKIVVKISKVFLFNIS